MLDVEDVPNVLLLNNFPVQPLLALSSEVVVLEIFAGKAMVAPRKNAVGNQKARRAVDVHQSSQHF